MADDPTSKAVHDPARLRFLRELGLLDSPEEDAFDRLTRLASRLLQAPVSLVSLVDENRQFFKSQVGLDEPWASRRETPLTHSFCKHVVATGEPLIVTDARLDPILKDNLALTDLNVVAYLGVPLSMENGADLGSFCVIDHQPRQWSAAQIELVKELGAAAAHEIELHHLIRQHKELKDQMSKALARWQTSLDDMQQQLENGVSPQALSAQLEQSRSDLETMAAQFHSS